MGNLAWLAALCAPGLGQEPPAGTTAGAAGAASAVLQNTGKPMVVGFRCTEEDMRWAGLACSLDDPCPVYLELAAAESTGQRVFAAGNIHTGAATLYTILLGSDDNGQSWREVHERVRGAGLDHVQFAGGDVGWVSGLMFAPLPQDPFLLLTTDGGRSWRAHPVFDEPRFGSIQQFHFEDNRAGTLVIDRGARASGDRWELYESNDGGETWNVKETSVKPIRPRRSATGNPEWRVRTDGPSKSFHVEHRVGQRWIGIGAFAVNLGSCKGE